MTKVKICGLTRTEEIEYINKCRSDYVGFVFTDSKRRVTPEGVKLMSQVLNPDIKKVGVFVNEDIELVNKTANECELDVIQLHGEESPDYCSRMCKTVWKVFRVKDKESIEKISQYPVDAILLDAFVDSDYGGTGKTFDWKLASMLGEKFKVVLAGGLNLTNVQEAIKIVRPYCVDVSSGVETDGIKDGAKIEEFIIACRKVI